MDNGDKAPIGGQHKKSVVGLVDKLGSAVGDDKTKTAAAELKDGGEYNNVNMK